MSSFIAARSFGRRMSVSRPRSAVQRWAIRLYFQRVLPTLIRLATSSPEAPLLMTYYWDTIDECVPPETIVAALRHTGFANVEQRTLAGCFSEYLAVKPAPARELGEMGADAKPARAT